MNDIQFMKLALIEAQTAFKEDEVPVGAIITRDDQLISQAHNKKEGENDPCAHAEVLAIQAACKNLGRWRLTDCTLYVTLEPCIMCVGAIISARLKRVVFAASDSKAGAVHSAYHFYSDTTLNHRPLWESGLLEEPCSQLLKDFFSGKRQK